MKFLGNNPIARTILAALTLGVLSVGIISLATMNHDRMMASADCPVAVNGGDCSQPKDSGVCLDYHLGVMQNLANAIPNNIGATMLGLMLFVLLAFVAFGLLDSTNLYYSRIRIRLKQLFEETVGVFQNQLGFWIAVTQKKDPSCAFALV
jgi:hypothetical protein